MVELTWV